MRVDSNEIEGFLIDKEGAMAILLKIDEQNGTLHTDFEDQVHISRATIASRLQEAEELGLLQRGRLPEDHGNAKRYQLTEDGKELRKALESVNLDTKYDQLQNLQEEIDEGLNEILTRIRIQEKEEEMDRLSDDPRMTYNKEPSPDSENE